MNSSVSITPGNSLYIDGMVVNLYDSTKNLIAIDPGQCRDSRNKVDIFNPNGVFLTTDFVGAGGLDSGHVEQNTTYAVYIIWDSTLTNPVSGVVSVQAVPVIPAGWDSYRLVGFFQTDDFGNFNDDICGNLGESNSRQCIFFSQVNIAIPPFSGINNVSLGAAIPSYLALNNILVTLGFLYTPGTSTLTMNAGPTSSIQTVEITSPGTAISVSEQANVICPYSQGSNSFWTFNSSNTDTVSIFFEKFYYEV